MSEKAAQKPQNGAPAQNTDKSKPKNKKKDLIEESPEDKKKREELALLVERLQDQDLGVQKLALESLRTEIRTSTTSMTSIPKPLKFLRAHYVKIKEIQQKMPQNDNNVSSATNFHTSKVLLCDILSVLALTSGKEGDRESLHYKMKGNMGDLGTWGHEYVK
jgi:26S proteasome regulatory subunit N1